jgi:hypothetical protein
VTICRHFSAYCLRTCIFGLFRLRRGRCGGGGPGFEKGIRIYRDTDTPPEAAGQEPDAKLDEEWNKQKKILFEHLKQMSDERFSISKDFSTLAALTLKLFHMGAGAVVAGAEVYL